MGLSLSLRWRPLCITLAGSIIIYADVLVLLDVGAPEVAQDIDLRRQWRRRDARRQVQNSRCIFFLALLSLSHVNRPGSISLTKFEREESAPSKLPFVDEDTQGAAGAADVLFLDEIRRGCFPRREKMTLSFFAARVKREIRRSEERLFPVYGRRPALIAEMEAKPAFFFSFPPSLESIFGLRLSRCFARASTFWRQMSIVPALIDTCARESTLMARKGPNLTRHRFALMC